MGLLAGWWADAWWWSGALGSECFLWSMLVSPSIVTVDAPLIKPPTELCWG
eukprot:CAMPEP_0173451376 /NCGR_PEP_ID=MMETSP1357-20121228/46683_1 /TAXON_ID=77926 /ORGANISM="Hemiselmis rufescens, Strain PCC563" /LENGTH=50 /DNA_ID=CAMNT_0014418139 /DNA_START=92 /DNA_END=241 /DNA_ORIENTATION=-